MGKNNSLDANISSFVEASPDDQLPPVGELREKPESPGCYFAALTAAFQKMRVPTGEGETIEKAIKGS
jgi:hypothetical protein